jgi:hypothetical protein
MKLGKNWYSQDSILNNTNTCLRKGADKKQKTKYKKTCGIDLVFGGKDLNIRDWKCSMLKVPNFE